jgi:hypothetical protein
MTPAKDIHVTIGQFRIKVGDIRAFDGFDLILKNGMRIEKESFKVKTDDTRRTNQSN